MLGSSANHIDTPSVMQMLLTSPESSAISIEKYMSEQVVTIDIDAPILRAGGLMLARGLHRLPVMENGKMVGIVSREDIYSAVLKKHLR